MLFTPHFWSIALPTSYAKALLQWLHTQKNEDERKGLLEQKVVAHSNALLHCLSTSYFKCLTQEKIEDERKGLLVQKVAALSGLESMAPLLAWSAASLKHHLRSNLKALQAANSGAAAAQGSEGSTASAAAALFYGDLQRAARAAGGCLFAAGG